ncbi:MAG: hypothetical protein F6J92_24725 [Symploca sp. SIO1A3]|nr:hypothetical protein [Symploca sp. SIO2C1]NER49825.1 hypothetical protein [Symploca sp. SIO1A3]
MKTFNSRTSACLVCRYYQPTGRRGGMCRLLSAPVRGSWKACSLGLPPFAPSWEGIERIWQNDQPALKGTLPTSSSFSCSNSERSVVKRVSTTEKSAAEIVMV